MFTDIQTRSRSYQMNPNRTACTDTALLLTYSTEALKLGFAIKHGEEDGDDAADHPQFYGVRGPTGVFRSELPDLSGRNTFSSDEILENDEEEHEEERLSVLDKLEGTAIAEGTIFAFRAFTPVTTKVDYPRTIQYGRKNQLRTTKVMSRKDACAMYLVDRTNQRRRPADRNVQRNAAPKQGQRPAPRTEQGQRTALQQRLEPVVGSARATEIARKANFGTRLGDKLASAVTAAAGAALGTKGEPAPHRLRHGVTKRSK
jgi:hypothetical protein